MIAQEMAMNHPQRVTELILGGTSVGGAGNVKPAPEIEAYMKLRLGLNGRIAYGGVRQAVYPREFIYEHPEIVEKKIRANLAFPS